MSGEGKQSFGKAALFGAVLLAAGLPCPASAAEVTAADVQAAMRSLGFLTALQNRPAISVAVVYHGGDTEGKQAASRIAAILAHSNGPGSATVQATIVTVQELSGVSQHVDALYLMPLPYDSARLVSDFVRKQNVVSLSADPACLDMGACVLMVQARASMTIVLDTALAQAVGAKFSTVFTMMVKRR